MYIKEGKGKLALFYTTSNVLLTPPPPHFLLSSLLILLHHHHHHHISVVFSPPPPSPPPPHFYCFPSTTTTTTTTATTFLLFPSLSLAPWVSKSTRKFGNHVTVHRPFFNLVPRAFPSKKGCPPVRLHHRKTCFQSHAF